MPLAFRASTRAAGHVGGGPGLVDQHQAVGIEIELAVEPALPLPQDVGPFQLDRVPGLFPRDLVTVEEPPQRAGPEPDGASRKSRPYFG